MSQADSAFESLIDMQYAYLAPYFRENLSYHHCKSISDTAMYANPARTEEIFIVNTFTDFDKEVFFAVRATGRTVNEAVFTYAAVHYLADGSMCKRAPKCFF